MNRTSLAVILLVAFLIFIPLGSAAPQTEIQVRDITPKPATSGDTVKLDVLVENSGSSEGIYLPMEVQTTEGITYRGTTSNYAENFSLCGGCQTVGTVYLKISENATTGSYPVDIVVENENGIGVVEKAVIEVDSTPNIVVAGDVEVRQGESSNFTLKLENIGKDIATQVTVSLDHPEMNFNPSTVQYGDMDTGESDTRTVKVTAEDDADSGPANVETTIEYVDGGEKIVQERSLSVQVLKDVELAISRVETEDTVIGSNSRIMVEIENIGYSRAESITSEVTCNGAEENENTDFVGSLDSDESVPTVYYVTPEKGSVECTLNVNYIGDTNQNLEETFTFEAERKANTLVLVIAGLLVLAGASYLYFKRKE